MKLSCFRSDEPRSNQIQRILAKLLKIVIISLIKFSYRKLSSRMTTKIPEEEYWQLFRLAKEYTDTQNKYSETLLEYPQDFGSGSILNIELREGLLLTIEDVQRLKNLTLDVQAQEHPLGFYFYLSAGFGSPRYGMPQKGDAFLFGGGMMPQTLYNNFSLDTDKVIYIHIEPEVFKKFVGIENDTVPPQLKYLFRHPDEEYYVINGKINTQMQIILQQIWQCPYQGLVKRMYLESKILELMALRLQQHIGEDITPKPVDIPKRSLMEKIYQAREILELHLNNPPTVLQLAEKVGLSHYQLKQGFQKGFGSTAFQYLHNLRMEKARLLLYERNMSVTQVANTVGYSHLGQFAAAFKRKFGISPNECLKGKLG